jgi:hypothetical protein
MNRLATALILFCVTASGWALRCHGNLVFEGDAQDLVQSKCGDPKDKETLTVSQPLYNDQGVPYGSTPYLTEVWTYQSSPQDFISKVYFTDKVVTSISSSDPSP